MIDPRTVFLAMPCGDGRMMAETAASLIRINGRFAAFTFKSEVSHVSLVRNFIADDFLRSGLEWLVSIDSDIVFEPDDFNLLMMPSDDSWREDGSPCPTRTRIEEIAGRNQDGTPKLMTSDADLLVCAEYPYKNDNLEPVKLGYGFVRVHRSVFETLQNLKHDDGQARLWQMTHHGRLICDYYPSGPMVGLHVPTAEWKGEDHGFWTLCMLAGLIPRIERRTRLVHVGRKAYCYQANGNPGQ